MKPTTIQLTDCAGLILIPTPGQPSTLTYQMSGGILTLMNPDSGITMMQLSGDQAKQALDRIKSWVG